MAEKSWTSTNEFLIPSESASGKQVIDRLIKILAGLDWLEHDVFGVHLSVEEAIVNSIKHGNRNDPNKKVRIVVKASRKQLWVQVTDEGDGFNPADVPDPTDDENLEMPSGRGLMLMRSFMSSITYSAKGNQVTMEKICGDL